MVKKVILIVMDSAGIGAMPDAGLFQDSGANTLRNIYRQRGRLEIPNLCHLGLGRLVDVGCEKAEGGGCFGKMFEKSPGKDTTTGHWEMAGIVLHQPFPTYPSGFPKDLIAAFEDRIGTSCLGNYASSGTVIIRDLGREHLKTGFPIVYTSADSVFQIAAHRDVVSLEVLYDYCRTARLLLTDENAVARVIARPFFGRPDAFVRDNSARRDFSIAPPKGTLLDGLKDGGYFVSGIGKIGDIFGHRGLTDEIHTDSNRDGIRCTIAEIRRRRNSSGLIFVNLVDFDMVYGHRRDVEGYARALEAFDSRIPDLMAVMDENDMLILTADHGCDPTHTAHTDHTREYVPLLVSGKPIRENVDLGIRTTFADCGATIADFFDIPELQNGKSFRSACCHG